MSPIGFYWTVIVHKSMRQRSNEQYIQKLSNHVRQVLKGVGPKRTELTEACHKILRWEVAYWPHSLPKRFKKFL